MGMTEEKAFAMIEIELRSILGNCLIALGLLILPHDERRRLGEVMLPHVDREIELLAVPPHA